jgi:hypothetical protein
MDICSTPEGVIICAVSENWEGYEKAVWCSWPCTSPVWPTWNGSKQFDAASAIGKATGRAVPFMDHSGWLFELAVGLLVCGMVSRKSRNEAWSETPSGPGKGWRFLISCTFNAPGEEYGGRAKDGTEVGWWIAGQELCLICVVGAWYKAGKPPA